VLHAVGGGFRPWQRRLRSASAGQDAFLLKRILFVCGRNRRRSPTAEAIFSDRPGIEVASAGLAPDADNPLTSELIDWADLILVMEKSHRTRLSRRFRRHLKGVRIACLDIPDRYAYMDPELIALLKARMERHLP
jgi:predicted protein tyrosine phosphatase